MKKRIIVIIAAAILVLIVGTGFGLGIYNSPANRLSRQLDLGQKYLEETDYEQAKIAFEKAIEIDPMNTEAYQGLADAYVNMEQYEEAATAYEALIEIDPMNAEAYLGAARAYEKLGDYERAMAVLQQGYKQTRDESIETLLQEYKQNIEEQISNYVNSFLCYSVFLPSTDPSPDKTYSYWKRLCSEKLPQLFEYLEMDIPDNQRRMILFKIKSCYLGANDINKSKEYWTKALELMDGEHFSNAEYDEYGRTVSYQNEGMVTNYEYYENSRLLKAYDMIEPCSTGEAYHDIRRTEIEEYDAEGRALKTVEYYYCGYVAEVDPQYPSKGFKSRETVYTYGANTCRSVAYQFDGNGVQIKGVYEIRSTYDETRNSVLYECYDEKGNLTHKSEYEYDEAGNVTSSRNYDGNGNLIETGE